MKWEFFRTVWTSVSASLGRANEECLICSRYTAHVTTGVSSAELFLDSELRSCLSVLISWRRRRGSVTVFPRHRNLTCHWISYSPCTRSGEVRHRGAGEGLRKYITLGISPSTRTSTMSAFTIGIVTKSCPPKEETSS